MASLFSSCVRHFPNRSRFVLELLPTQDEEQIETLFHLPPRRRCNVCDDTCYVEPRGNLGGQMSYMEFDWEMAKWFGYRSMRGLTPWFPIGCRLCDQDVCTDCEIEERGPHQSLAANDRRLCKSCLAEFYQPC